MLPALTRRGLLAGASAALALAARPARELPESRSGQPEPVITMVANAHLDGQTTTSIARRWQDDRADGCRLCPRDRCHVQHGVCLVTVVGFVSDDDAPLFDLGAYLGGTDEH